MAKQKPQTKHGYPVLDPVARNAIMRTDERITQLYALQRQHVGAEIRAQALDRAINFYAHCNGEGSRIMEIVPADVVKTAEIFYAFLTQG